MWQYVSENDPHRGRGLLDFPDDDLKGDSGLTGLMRERGVEVVTVSHFLSELEEEI